MTRNVLATPSAACHVKVIICKVGCLWVPFTFSVWRRNACAQAVGFWRVMPTSVQPP